MTNAVKSLDGVALASVKAVNGVAIASVKAWNGLTVSLVTPVQYQIPGAQYLNSLGGANDAQVPGGPYTDGF